MEKRLEKFRQNTQENIFFWKNIREKRHLRQPTMERRVGVSAKYIQTNAFWAKYNGQKLHFGRKCNKESVEVTPLIFLFFILF